MGRCMQPTAPLREISASIPERLLSRINIIPKPSAKSHEEIASKRKQLTTLRCSKEQTEGSVYNPRVLEKVPLSLYSHELLRTPASSMRIPGALVVDPRVRKIADARDMKTSEYAIWLLVVALKEFTVTVLGDTISTMKAIETGSVPVRPSIRPRLLPKKVSKIESNSPVMIPLEHQNPATKCISPLDIHLTTTGIPSGSKSLGGCLSRTTFERSLLSSFDSSLVIGGNAFHEVKKFLVSAVSSIEPVLKKTRGETSTPRQVSIISAAEAKVSDQSLRKSSVSKGLGRGAKDLASLKEQSSVSAPPLTAAFTSVSMVEETINSGTTEDSASGSFPSSSKSPLTPPSQQEQLSVNHQRKQNDQENDDVSGESGGENQSAATPRKGKGFGVKNLAAMRARSLTSQSEGAAETASENREPTAQPLAPASVAPGSVPALDSATSDNSATTTQKMNVSPTTTNSLQSSALRDSPTVAECTPAVPNHCQVNHQKSGIAHNSYIPSLSQNSRIPSEPMQNSAVATANAQRAQGFATFVVPNASQVSGPPPVKAPFPGHQGMSLGQLAQMVPGIQQGRHFGQLPSPRATHMPHHMQHVASSLTAQNAQTLAFAQAFAQNMANTAAVNHGVASVNEPSVQAVQAAIVPAAPQNQNFVAQPPTEVGIESARPTSRLLTTQPNATAFATESSHQQGESKEAQK